MQKITSMAFCVAASLLLLCSCATPYQPHGFLGGYKDTQLDSNTFRVSFHGNDETARETVLNYLLYRCAEVTLKNDSDFFVIVDGGSDVRHLSMTMPGTYSGHTTYHDTYMGGTATTHGTYSPGMTLHGRAFSETAVIKLFRGEAPPNVPNCYVAKELMTYLEANIQRPKSHSKKPK
jgi:hypothetical protein